MKNNIENGTFICSINDCRYLDDVRVLLNLGVDSAPEGYHIDSIIVTIDDHDFSAILQIAITYTEGNVTAWEVFA